MDREISSCSSTHSVPSDNFLVNVVSLAANCPYLTTLKLESEISSAISVTKSQRPMCHNPILLLVILITVSHKISSRVSYAPGWWHRACECWHRACECCPWGAQIVALTIWTAFLQSCGEKK